MQTSRRNYSGKPRKKQKTERVTGDALSYFILHNLISVGFFFLFTVGLEVYEISNIEIGELFTLEFFREFWSMVIFDVFCFSVVSSIIGRSSAFLLIRGYFSVRNKKRKKQKTMKRWTELNSGINKFNLVVFLVTAFLTSIVFSIGIIATLNYKIFDESSLLTLVVIYSMFKIGIYFVVKYITKART